MKQHHTPTRAPVSDSSSKYDDGARALVPYSLHSPRSKSGISHSYIDQWPPSNTIMTRAASASTSISSSPPLCTNAPVRLALLGMCASDASLTRASDAHQPSRNVSAHVRASAGGDTDAGGVGVYECGDASSGPMAVTMRMWTHS